MGFTNNEMAEMIGLAVLEMMEREGLQITWKPKVD